MSAGPHDVIELKISDEFEQVPRDWSVYPQLLMIPFDLGAQPIGGLLGASLSLQSWHEEDGSGFATIAIAHQDRSFALYAPQDASSLRAIAAGMLRLAAKLDGGKGVQ